MTLAEVTQENMPFMLRNLNGTTHGRRCKEKRALGDTVRRSKVRGMFEKIKQSFTDELFAVAEHIPAIRPCSSLKILMVCEILYFNTWLNVPAQYIYYEWSAKATEGKSDSKVNMQFITGGCDSMVVSLIMVSLIMLGTHLGYKSIHRRIQFNSSRNVH